MMAPIPLSQLNRECPIKEKNLKALEQMDKMMDEILVNDISNMCPFSFGTQNHKTPTSSKSDGHICRTNKYVICDYFYFFFCAFGRPNHIYVFYVRDLF